MLRIKMCGMTRREDVLAAARLGVDAVGLVFYPASPRHVTAAQAYHLVRDLPPFVARVGLFVDAPLAEIMATVASVGLSAVQLYGGPGTKELAEAKLGVPVIRGLHASDQLHQELSRYSNEAVLVDAPRQALPGGTGRTWDWSTLKEAPRPRYLMLAGGLQGMNVAEAVRLVKPDAVDVSSGVEFSPGVKDPQRMKAFVAACAPFRNSSRERL